MTKLPWTPWHKVVTLREDVRTGELALNEFAADLYDVASRSGRRPIYEDPAQFFAMTFPTYGLRELAKDVVVRLAAKNQKAIRQLELTYGGGKTHALITLYHLVHDPENLPDIPAVREFRSHIGLKDLPRARVAVLPFDKFDVEKGLEVKDPEGRPRMLRQPWSALAWQLVGEAGLRLLHPDDKPEERKAPPAENLLVSLLSSPAQHGLATLLLIDEVLMFVRTAVDADPGWRTRLVDFFQYLTQAATKVDRCAIVASLLATDPRKQDQVGREITNDLYDIFRREREESVEPVGKKDIAEVLRRRFFTPKSIEKQDTFRQPVIDALQGIAALDDETRKKQKEEEDRFTQSYPFHPDLTEVLYSKWTQLEGFQRTRGILRTFALALRDAEKWDSSPLVGPNVFLPARDGEQIAEAARELTQVARVEDTEGKWQEWNAIISGELEKACRIQDEYGGLKHRELEQAVLATFLHSQPIGQKAQLRELIVLVGATRPDRIEFQKALREWFDRSWFLDESADIGVKAEEGVKPAPSTWRLGSRPNLKQMHADERGRISDEAVDARLEQQIRGLRSLKDTASASGARVHMLPARPADIEDDGEFRYAVLGPEAASESGKPSSEARRFIDETTSPDRPRKERNVVVLAVPSRDGIAAARETVRDHLAWLGVRDILLKEKHELDEIRRENLEAYTAAAVKRIAETIRQAYCIVVTVSEQNEVHAFKVHDGEGPLFSVIKQDPRARIQETAISADALLPGGPYQLWKGEEDARRVKDLVGAFARFPHLPKMLNREAILDTVVNGCAEGVFVARLVRPDKSARTWWRERPEREILDDPGLELVLPEKAFLSRLPPSVLYPDVLDELWARSPVRVSDAHALFDGKHSVTVNRGGFEEPLPVPSAVPDIVNDAIRTCVKEGKLWLLSGPVSFLAEEVPSTLVTADAELTHPPDPISPLDVLPDRLPQAWRDGHSDALSIAVACSKRLGKTLPWVTIREALDGAFRAHLMERTEGSAPWPADYSRAADIKVRLATERSRPEPPVSSPTYPPGTSVSREAMLRADQIQDLAEVVPDLIKVTAGFELGFGLRVVVKGKDRPPAIIAEGVNKLLAAIGTDLHLD
jgi:hypothetical protein